MGDADAIRTFIALELPGSVRERLAQWTDQLHAFWPEGALRSVRADNLHLTLRFLGDTEPERLSELVAGIETIAQQQAAFEVTLYQLGGFPSLRRGHVVWVGVAESGDDRMLQPLQKQVELLARKLGWQRQRQAFTPHITVARVRGRGQHGRFGDGGPPAVAEHSFEMTTMTLVRSDIAPAGAHYHVLHRAQFGAAGST